MFCTCWLATCAWRHRSVQLFDVWTSKSGPKPRFFNILTYKLTNVTAAFWHTNFKKVVWEWCVLSFYSGVPFFDGATCKVCRTGCVLGILNWKCASRHSGVKIFISPLTTWLRARRFSEPTFRPSRRTNHWKNKVFHDFSEMLCTRRFFLLTLLLCFAFHLTRLRLTLLARSAFHLPIL